MQYTEIFKVVKNDNFQWKFLDIFFIFAQNIDCGYTLEPPRRGGSNEYPQSMFWSKNEKKQVYPPQTPFFYIKVGFKGVYFLWTCFPDVIVIVVSMVTFTSCFSSNPPFVVVQVL